MIILKEDETLSSYILHLEQETEQSFRKPNASLIREYLSQKDQHKTNKDKLIFIYNYYFHIHQSSLGHYFRNLYCLVKYADDSNFNISLKKSHIRILRAQLSNYELLILAYNCLHKYGEKFYPLVETYELLKSLNDESNVPQDYEKRIIDISILRDAYPHLQKLQQVEIKSIAQQGL